MTSAVSRFLSVRRLATIGILTAAWLALWGEVSIANIGSGLVVASLVSAAAVSPENRGRVRIVPLVRLLVLVAIDLVTSTVAVAREVLTPTDRTDEAIVAVDLPAAARAHLLLLVVAVTVTPGTAVVDVDADRSTLYLHLLHSERRDVTTARIRRMADLACRALPATESSEVRSR